MFRLESEENLADWTDQAWLNPEYFTERADDFPEDSQSERILKTDKVKEVGIDGIIVSLMETFDLNSSRMSKLEILTAIVKKFENGESFRLKRVLTDLCYDSGRVFTDESSRHAVCISEDQTLHHILGVITKLQYERDMAYLDLENYVKGVIKTKKELLSDLLSKRASMYDGDDSSSYAYAA